MKRWLLLVILALSVGITYAQVNKDSWAVGFGLAIPRFVGADVTGGEIADGNLGIHGTVQVNLSEHSNFRWTTRLFHLAAKPEPTKVTAFETGFDYLFHVDPCEIINPYFGLGVSAIFYDLKGATAPVKNEFRYDYQSNVIFGVQWGYFDEWLGNDLKVKTELALHTVANDQFDGRLGPQGGIFGGGLDNYFTYDFGLLYYFDLGARSTYCDLYEGIVTVRVDTGANRPQQLVDYQQIEEIVARNSNAAVDYQRIEAMIKKYLGNVQPGQQKGQEYREVYNVSQSPNWVLLGINFDPGKATFRPEAYPILINAAQVLISNPALKVEILGYTDNVGTQEANKKLSLQRANAVLQFLASKGIDNSRLTAKGLGDADPIGDNKTNEGRGFNRRIEFKIIR